jgi:hypothetical protein
MSLLALYPSPPSIDHRRCCTTPLINYSAKAWGTKDNSGGDCTRAVVDVSRTATKKTDYDDNSDKVRSKRGVVDNLSVISVTIAELIVTGRAFETRMETYAALGQDRELTNSQIYSPYCTVDEVLFFFRLLECAFTP